ncbi:hypothetical protein TAGGR_2247 [Thermodesulfovibrio aggregans]|uniref:Uncharacterized protein n=1 Tax=Thermodesulfovibrio aggregans TaxID=86166 RepID=A0A0U9HWY2_9BACT|nr:hypothetical protein [Thermodesulfovibrio aggregans]GAQ95357.1 hypothetical protein TAGGR_2247 [Thermodesulfovibrio aggregans]
MLKKENIWNESVYLSSESKFTKELKILILLFIVVVLELPIIFLLLKPAFHDEKDFYLFIFAMIFMILGVFSIVVLSAPSKLYSISVNRHKNSVELRWIRNLFLEKIETIPFEKLSKIYVSIVNTRGKNRVIIKIEKIDGNRVNAVFTLLETDKEEIANVFLNMALIAGFQSYTAFREGNCFSINFSKGFEEKTRLNYSSKLVFEEGKRDIEKDKLRITNLVIEELNPLKVILYRKPNLFDIVRFLILYLIFPLLFLFILIYEKTQKLTALSISLFAYVIILYLTRRMIAPMNILIDKMRGTVKVKKIIYSYTFPISEIKEIQISDMIGRRTGTFLFFVDAIMKDNRKNQLFFIEVKSQESLIHETYVNIKILLDQIFGELNIPIIEMTKNF